jgi:lysozyme
VSNLINFLVVDLSHYDPCNDYGKLAAAGIIGCIYKSTQGQSYTDPTYKAQRDSALAAGVLWGSYHFGDGSNPQGQVNNYLSFTDPQPDEIICLDFEDNGNNSMSIKQAQEFIDQAEQSLGRQNQAVFYSGNRAKDLLGSKVNAFLGARRLWLAQYGTNPVVQASWDSYWLWQYTDGTSGPSPHTAPGCDPQIDCNSYDGSPEQLAAEWASGAGAPVPPAPVQPLVVTLTIDAPPGVTVNVIQKVSNA